jgi:tRNA threonylcarbamoyladenosine biosynthesis protein TsaE
MEFTLEELPKFAQDFVKKLPQDARESAHVVGLKGNLGAGKTAFVQNLAKVLGVKEVVTSPTFVIAQSYATNHPVFKKLVHIDAYRLENETKDTIGLADYLNDPQNLVLIEWPAYLPTKLPEGTAVLEFKVVDEDRRNISYV